MNYKQMILDMLKENNGIITTREVIKKGIPKGYLTKLVGDGEIERIKRGIYGDKNKLNDEFYIFQLRYPNAIFSYNTALYMHGLTERTPSKLDVTVYRGHTGRKLDHNIATHFVKKEIVNLGVITVLSPYGNQIKIYDKERCICDLIKSKNKMDLELSNKIIFNYFDSKDKNINKLFDYATKMNILEKLYPYIGVSI